MFGVIHSESLELRFDVMLRVREITNLVSSQISIECYGHTYAGAYWPLQLVGPHVYRRRRWHWAMACSHLLGEISGNQYNSSFARAVVVIQAVFILRNMWIRGPFIYIKLQDPVGDRLDRPERVVGHIWGFLRASAAVKPKPELSQPSYIHRYV